MSASSTGSCSCSCWDLHRGQQLPHYVGEFAACPQASAGPDDWLRSTACRELRFRFHVILELLASMMWHHPSLRLACHISSCVDSGGHHPVCREQLLCDRCLNGLMGGDVAARKRGSRAQSVAGLLACQARRPVHWDSPRSHGQNWAGGNSHSSKVRTNSITAMKGHL